MVLPVVVRGRERQKKKTGEGKKRKERELNKTDKQTADKQSLIAQAVQTRLAKQVSSLLYLCNLAKVSMIRE